MARRCDPLPTFPGDTIGPPSRHGLSRVGVFGDRFVARSNPIGVLFDALRSFCSPLPQTEVAEGEFVADGDLSTNVATDEFGGGGAPAQDYQFPYDTIGQVYDQPVMGGRNCGAGTVFDQALQSCVPAPSSTPAIDTAGTDAASAARQALATARSANDCEGVRRVLDTARVNQGSNRSGATYLRWHPIAVSALAWLNMPANRKRCKL